MAACIKRENLSSRTGCTCQLVNSSTFATALTDFDNLSRLFSQGQEKLTN